ncbi:RdRP-domain-containing protein [Clavulina sp. PMI_390]|nr:RdRP-domain-containing protein [Clavulina sp. PMI_390]
MPYGVKRRHSSFKGDSSWDGVPATPPPPRNYKRRKVQADPGRNLPAPIPLSSTERTQSDDPGCALKLYGFPEDITLAEVQETLEEFFDDDEFTDCTAGATVNFSVRFLGHGRGITALVTLPFSSLEDAYWEYGKRIFVEGQRAPIKVSQEPLNPWLLDGKLVEHLRTTPYKSSAAAVKEAALRKRLETRIPVSRFSFGVWSQEPDQRIGGGSFSAEYPVEGDPSPRSSIGSISIWYDSDRRAILVQRIGRPDETVPDGSSGDPIQIAARPLIIARVRNISRIQLCTNPPGFFLDMRHPLIFEDDDPDDPDERLRFHCFDAIHARFEGSVSKSIFVQFGDFTYQQWISSMKVIPHIPHISDEMAKPVAFHAGKLYSLKWLHTLRTWYAELPLEIALRCEQAVRSHILRPEDILYCKDPINAAIEQSGVKIAALTVQHLSDFMASPKGRDALSSIDLEDAAGRVEQLHGLLMQAGEKAVNEVRYGKRWANPDVALCHHIYVTPTSFIVEPPQRDRSNRVLRKYPDHQHHFLRVSFSDEGGHGSRLKRGRFSSVEFSTFVGQFVGDVLSNGLQIAGRNFEWLGYSTSALKDHQMLFMTPFTIDSENGEDLITAQRIRDEMGIFSAELRKQPAKFGARLGQAFTATNSSIEIPAEAIKVVDDIKRNNYCFTDGAGEMSPELAREIWSSVKRRRGRNTSAIPPSAFQARFGGCKGVWMVNPQLKGLQILCRKSQMKYESNERGFDIANTSERPTKTFLNRPLVKLLEDLGVSTDTLLGLQSRAITSIERAQQSFQLASKLLRDKSLGTQFRASTLMLNMTEMLDLDFTASPHQHIDFWKSVTMLAITHSLRDLKYKARIPVEGPTLIGVCDTFGILKKNEVYVKVVEKGVAQDALKGTVAITRSPLAQAIGEVPAYSPLASLTNVLVFSAEGERPLSNMLGGGDLDGDLFNVITDPQLHPQVIASAGSYEAVQPHVLDEPCKIDDMADFVVDYIVGTTRHLEIADISKNGSFDEDCLRLAQLASQAVDFQKSGVPVEYSELPKGRSKFRPDFLARAEDDVLTDCYPSTKALGRLFRAVPIQKYARPNEEDRGKVDASVLFKALQETTGRFPHLPLTLCEPFELEADWGASAATFCDLTEKIAFRNSPARDSNLKLLEEELFLGTLGSSQRLESDDYNLVYRARMQVAEVVRTLRREIKDLDREDAEADDSDDEEAISPRGAPAPPVSRAVKQAERRKILLDRLGLLPDYNTQSSTSSEPTLAVSSTVSPPNDEEAEPSSDDEVVEITRPDDIEEIRQRQRRRSSSRLGSQHQGGTSGSSKDKAIVISDSEEEISHPGNSGDEDENADIADDESVLEATTPSKPAAKADVDLVVIQRAFNACHYALGGLSEDGVVPYGLRLFAYVALDVLLATIRRRTAFGAPVKQEAQAE